MLELDPNQEYRVLSVQPPWAWAILFGGKDIENRTWTTRHRGPLLIHASSKLLSKAGLDEVRRELARCTGRPLRQIPEEFPRSQLLGLVDLVDIVDEHDSPWAYEGNWFWVLRNPRPLHHPVLDVHGKLGIWRWRLPQR